MQSSVTDTTNMSCTCGRHVCASNKEILDEYFNKLFGKRPMINLPYHEVRIITSDLNINDADIDNVNIDNVNDTVNNSVDKISDNTENNVNEKTNFKNDCDMMADVDVDTHYLHNVNNIEHQSTPENLPIDYSLVCVYARNYNFLRILFNMPPIEYKE